LTVTTPKTKKRGKPKTFERVVAYSVAP
jgi:hypothetical protein